MLNCNSEREGLKKRKNFHLFKLRRYSEGIYECVMFSMDGIYVSGICILYYMQCFIQNNWQGWDKGNSWVGRGKALGIAHLQV